MIFISYSSKDGEWVADFYNKLIKHHILSKDLYLDKYDIKENTDIVANLNENLFKAKVFIIVLSRNLDDSFWQQREILYAQKKTIELQNVKMLCVCIEKDFAGANLLPPLIQTIKYYDFSTKDKFDNKFQDLLSNIITAGLSSLSICESIEKIYLDNKHIVEFNNAIDACYYSNIFSSFISVNNQPCKPNELFLAEIYELIDQSNEPVVIEGKPGTGKSSFLNAFYCYVKNAYINNSSNYLPIYLNLDKYNNINNIEEATCQLKSDIQLVKEFASVSRNAKILFVIDGLDNYFRFKIEINSALISYIQKLSGTKKIFGISLSEYKFNKHQKIDFNLSCSNRLDTKSIQAKNSDLKSLLSSLYCVIRHKEMRSIDYNQIISILNKIHLSEPDFFQISLIVKKHDALIHNLDNIINVITFYQYCIYKDPEFNRIDKNYTTKLAFDYYIQEIDIADKSSVDYRISWRVINYNNSFRDYFIAQYIIDNIIKYKDGIAKEDGPRIGMFNHVYQDQINKYCKLLMNEDNATQNDVIEAIFKIYDTSSKLAQTHFCYLLGRIENEALQEKCRKFLFQLKRDLYNEKYKKASSKKKYDKHFLLLLRTIFISLANLGSKDSANEYLEILSQDKMWDKINRGFHLEYYGDIPFAPKDGDILMLIDDGDKPINQTFNKLLDRLSLALNERKAPNLFSIELYTICSLVQHRQVNGNEPHIDAYVKKLDEYLSNLLIRKPNFINENIKRYIKMLQQHLKRGSCFCYGNIIFDILNIKNEIRKGWTCKGRSIELEISPIETVASHTLGAVYIAKILLPDNYIGEDDIMIKQYNKNKIIDILLYHDITEAYLGDEIREMKGPEYRAKEIETIQYINNLSSYADIANLKEVYNNWIKFEDDLENIQDINFQIAKEIDKLDNLYQLIYYKVIKRHEIPDFDGFLTNLSTSINTELGDNIRKILLAPYKQEINALLEDEII